MFIYGKTATNAIAVMSYVAAEAPRRVGSAVIAETRKISPVLTAKLLTQLAAAGFVSGRPGPGGGYTLAKDAADIRLIDIVALFEQIDNSSRCPFGSEWCGSRTPCPLHDSIIGLTERNRRFLEETRLSVFHKKPVASKPPQSRLKSVTNNTARPKTSRSSGKSST